MPGRFEGKVVIVTGSTNGIGRDCAVYFASEGAFVTTTGRSAKHLEETERLMIEAGGQASIGVLGDLRSSEVQRLLVEETIAKHGKIDILINNAGGVAPDNTPEIGFEQTSETYDYIMDLNVKCVLELTKLAMPHLMKSKGEVVIVSSIAAKPFSIPSYPYYAMSKAALDQLTRSLAGTYIKQGVRVNAVNPGVISTTIAQKQGATPELQNFFESMYEGDDCIPIGRIGQPRDVTELIAFLADRSKSEYIVGQCLVIDGGATLLCPMFHMDMGKKQ